MRFCLLGQLNVPEQLDAPEKKANLGDAATEVLRDEFGLPGCRSVHQGALIPVPPHHLWHLSVLEKPGGLVRPSVLLGESVRHEADLVGLQLGGPGHVLAMRELQRGT